MSVILKEEEIDLSSQYEVIKFINKDDSIRFLYIKTDTIKGTREDFLSIRGVGFEPKDNIEDTLKTARLICFSCNKMLKDAVESGVFKPNQVYRVTLAEKDVKSKTSSYRYNKFDIGKTTLPDTLISKLKALIPNNGMEMEETSIDISTPAPKNI